MAEIKATIRISRFQGTINGISDAILVSLIDEKSGVEFFRGTMELPELALCLTGGRGRAVGSVDAENVGKKREVKTEFVAKAPKASYKLTEEARDAALSPHEVDGWKARRGDYGNPHQRGKIGENHGYHVSFTRFVDDE